VIVAVLSPKFNSDEFWRATGRFILLVNRPHMWLHHHCIITTRPSA
jgi:hypothetical protein